MSNKKLKESLGISDEPDDSVDRSIQILKEAGVTDKPNLVEYESNEVVIPKLNLKSVNTTIPDDYESDVAKDYIFGRNVLYTMIDASTEALAGALEVAKESQHPRAYEVLNQIIGTTSGLSKDLLSLQKVYKDIQKDVEPSEQPQPQGINYTQNNFTTSSHDLLKMVNDAQNGKSDE